MNGATHSKRNILSICVAVVALTTSGCVSTTTHEKMQAEKNKEITDLQQQKSDLETQKSELESQKSELQTQLAALEKQKAALEQQTTTLEQQKSALETASAQRQDQYNALMNKMSEEVKKGELKVRQYQNMLSVDVAEQIFFDSGRAKLKGSAKSILAKLGEALQGYDNKIIRVVGHTDNVPLAKSLQSTFPTNWELSVARATNVVHALQDAGVPPERLVASGRGEYDPVAPNDTPEGRQKNRRIEIMLIDASLVEQMEKPKQ